MLPPYETDDTLARLADEVRALNPAEVVCLGDSFDDLLAVDELTPAAFDLLAGLQAGRRWTWIEGNHDAGPIEVGGTHRAELTYRGLTFRHIATASPTAEVSGHYHPKARLNLRGRSVSRPCFLVDSCRLILPAFGTYTGGLRTSDVVLSALMDTNAEAILTGPTPARIPMPR